MNQKEEEKNHSNTSTPDQSKLLRSRQEQILSMTTELKSHFVLGKYFVDPDKNFNKLLESIIVSSF